MSWDEDRVAHLEKFSDKYRDVFRKQHKELCSSHGITTVDVTIACSNITSKVCINCGLE